MPEKVSALRFTQKSHEFPSLEQTCWCSLDQFSPWSQICTFHATELHPISFLTPPRLSVFSTVVDSPSLPLLFLLCLYMPHICTEFAFSTMPCRGWPQNWRKFPCGRQEQEKLVYTAPPPLPEFKVSPADHRPAARRCDLDVLQASILWAFQDRLMHCPNQTDDEIMLHSGILVERHCCLIFPTD